MIKKILRGLGIAVLVIVLLLAGAYFMMCKQASRAMAALVNVPISMEQVADGCYYGASDGGMIKVEVQVTVKEHRVTDINLLRHDCGAGKPAERILDAMVAKNTDDVDSISGATLSSKTIRNAVNVALQQGLAE